MACAAGNSPHATYASSLSVPTPGGEIQSKMVIPMGQIMHWSQEEDGACSGPSPHAAAVLIFPLFPSGSGPTSILPTSSTATPRLARLKKCVSPTHSKSDTLLPLPFSHRNLRCGMCEATMGVPPSAPNYISTRLEKHDHRI